MHPLFARVETLIFAFDLIQIQIAMSTSRNELENTGRERYTVKDVKAKVQVGRISKELKVTIEFFDR